MTIEEMQAEKQNLLQAIKRRNADLRRFKEDRDKDISALVDEYKLDVGIKE